jgi:hypothetical protein
MLNRIIKINSDIKLVINNNRPYCHIRRMINERVCGTRLNQLIIKGIIGALDNNKGKLKCV